MSETNICDKTVAINTPLGDIVVTIKGDSSDPESYPGVYVDLKGPGLNDLYEKDTVDLAGIEYDPTKNAIQTIVYGDGNEDEYSHLVVHKNLLRGNNAHDDI